MPQPAPEPRQATRHGGTPYGLKALDAECHAITRAPFGRQEPTLNEAGLKVGALIAGGELEEGPAVAELLAAARGIASEPGREPWTPAEIEKKLRRAVSDGKARPRQAPPRAAPHREPSLEPPPPIEDEAWWQAVSEAADAEAHLDVDATPPAAPAAEARQMPAIPILYWDEITPALDADDFVEGLLIKEAMSVTYGQSNSGKTFFKLDLALHVAAGLPWCGRAVEQGGVIWLAMEGSYGIRNRLEAWKRERGMEDARLPFAVVPVALNLLDPEADTDRLIALVAEAAARMEMPVKLIVVDTLSRAMAGGNENAPDDMGALVTNGTKIQQAVKAHVSWIHHSGKDEAKGARGHSLLRAATDTEIEVTADGAQRMARVTKQRELDCAGDFPFTLKVVVLGPNKRGKPVTSCVVEGLDEGHTAGAVLAPRLKGHTRRALDVLHDLLAESGKGGFPGVPDSCLSVPEDWWRQRFYDRTVNDGKDDVSQDGKRKAFVRAAQELQDRRLVGVMKGRVWSIRPGQNPGQKAGQNE